MPSMAWCVVGSKPSSEASGEFNQAVAGSGYPALKNTDIIPARNNRIRTDGEIRR